MSSITYRLTLFSSNVAGIGSLIMAYKISFSKDSCHYW